MTQAPKTSQSTNGLEQGEWPQLPAGKGTRAYCHLFGPVAFVAIVTLLFIACAWLWLKTPPSPTDLDQAIHVQASADLAALLDSYIKDYGSIES